MKTITKQQQINLLLMFTGIGSSDIITATKMLEESGLNSIPSFDKLEIKHNDICYLILEKVRQKALNELNQLLPYSEILTQFEKICTYSNYSDSRLDNYHNIDEELFKKELEENNIDKSTFSDTLQYFLDEIDFIS